ncbi:MULTISPECIES: hypothetical protein [unclassified Limnohabitans]|uniref:hypothetical protein n=1 Tax=unclassified Limnohabitans TaxID=2626134 RepID=UPI00117A16C9|nr:MULTISPECIES: hypothetical protein [unclassified Limnohabitans]
MSHHHPRRLIPTQSRGITSSCLIAATLLWLIPPVTRAQTVYRCGDQYSATALCQNSTAPAVQDTRNAEQTKAQERLTLQTQREAQALEKNRLQSERRASVHSPAVTPAWPQDSALPQSSGTAPDTLAPPHHAHSQKVNPYFTAKDGSTHSNSGKAKQPVKKKTSSDTAQKP